jgi:hypothetical protein
LRAAVQGVAAHMHMHMHIAHAQAQAQAARAPQLQHSSTALQTASPARSCLAPPPAARQGAALGRSPARPTHTLARSPASLPAAPREASLLPALLLLRRPLPRCRRQHCSCPRGRPRRRQRCCRRCRRRRCHRRRRRRPRQPASGRPAAVGRRPATAPAGPPARALRPCGQASAAAQTQSLPAHRPGCTSACRAQVFWGEVQRARVWHVRHSMARMARSAHRAQHTQTHTHTQRTHLCSLPRCRRPVE